MKLRRFAKRHQAGVDTTLWWEFQPGDRVLTVEGIFGRVTNIEDGPFPGNEQYMVELDMGLGGGAYTSSELRNADSDSVEPGFGTRSSKIAARTWTSKTGLEWTEGNTFGWSMDTELGQYSLHASEVIGGSNTERYPFGWWVVHNGQEVADGPAATPQEAMNEAEAWAKSKGASKTSALQIREYNYRGEDGYRLSGTLPGKAFPVSIFVKSREAAERIRDKLKADPDYQTTMEDLTYEGSKTADFAHCPNCGKGQVDSPNDCPECGTPMSFKSERERIKVDIQDIKNMQGLSVLRQAARDPENPTVGIEQAEELASSKDYTHSGLVVKALDSGRVLLTQRTPYEGDPEGVYGRWEFPGGSVDNSGDPIASAIREFEEETGLVLPEGYYIEGAYDSGTYLAVVCLVPNEAWTAMASLLMHETEGVGWFDIEDIEGSDLVREEMEDSDWDMIREALKKGATRFTNDGTGNEIWWAIQDGEIEVGDEVMVSGYAGFTGIVEDVDPFVPDTIDIKGLHGPTQINRFWVSELPWLEKVSSKTASQYVVEDEETGDLVSGPFDDREQAQDDEEYQEGNRPEEDNLITIRQGSGDHVASDDYPELTEVLIERPPPQGRMRVKAALDKLAANKQADIADVAEAVRVMLAQGMEQAEVVQAMLTAGLAPYSTVIEAITQVVSVKESGIMDRLLEPVADYMVQNQQFDPNSIEVKRAANQWAILGRDDRGERRVLGTAKTLQEAQQFASALVESNQPQAPQRKFRESKEARSKTYDSVDDLGEGGDSADILADALSDLVEDESTVFEGTLDPEFQFHITSAWNDVQDKASRIRRDGHVRVISSTPAYLVGEVRGDTDIYQAVLHREGSSSRVALWECGCAWAAYSWGRSGRWKKFEGRMCSHALALLYESQSRGWGGQPISEDAEKPNWLTDPFITVKQPGDYKKPGYGEWRLDASLKKGAPFAGYDDFDACVAANQDKDSPEAYCGAIKDKVEGRMKPVSVDPVLRSAPAFTIAKSMQGAPLEERAEVLRSLGVRVPEPFVKAAVSKREAAAQPNVNRRKIEAKGEGEKTGAMVALRPSDELLEKIALEGGEPLDELHITLGYLGKADEVDQLAVDAAVKAWAYETPPMTGNLTGYGMFDNDDKVLYASVSIPGLKGARQRLVDTLGVYGVKVASDYDFVPHLTLAYGDFDVPDQFPREASGEFHLGEVFTVMAGDWESIPLRESEMKDEPEAALPETTADDEIDASDFMGDETDLADEGHPAPEAILEEDPDQIGEDTDLPPVESRSWLMDGGSQPSGSGGDISDGDIALAAKQALKEFTVDEQQDLINEGEGVTARNLDRLDIAATHYEALERAFEEEEETENDDIWLVV